MATVECTRIIRFYLNDEQVDVEYEYVDLLSGYRYTPSAHMPSYDSDVYTDYTIRYNGLDYTTGSFICPDTDFTITYRFYGYTKEDPSWYVDDVTESSATIYVSDPGDYSYFSYSVKTSDGSSYVAGPTSYNRTKICEFNGLAPGTRYRAYLSWSTTSSGEGNYDWCYFTTASAVDPTYTTTKTKNQINVIITNTGSYSYFNYSLRDSSNSTTLQGPSGYITNTRYTFSGLKANTTYIVCLNWSTSTIGQGNVAYITVTTDSVNVAKWDWSIANISSSTGASASQTAAAYTALYNKSYVSGFSYKVWNDLVDKVVQVWHAQDGYFDTSILSYDATKMTPSDKVMTAARFNSLRNNIDLGLKSNNASTTGLNTVSKGNIVYAGYFLTLATYINKWIDAI